MAGTFSCQAAQLNLEIKHCNRVGELHIVTLSKAYDHVSPCSALWKWGLMKQAWTVPCCDRVACFDKMRSADDVEKLSGDRLCSFGCRIKTACHSKVVYSRYMIWRILTLLKETQWALLWSGKMPSRTWESPLSAGCGICLGMGWCGRRQSHGSPRGFVALTGLAANFGVPQKITSSCSWRTKGEDVLSA